MKTSRWSLLIFASATLGILAAHPAKAAQARQNLAETKSEVLPFIADDYARALAEARARKVPLFVESWAPW